MTQEHETPNMFISRILSGNFTEDIFMLVPISVPAKSITISSGMLSAGHFNSTFLLTIFKTPPLFKPGESELFLNFTGISITIFDPDTILIKST